MFEARARISTELSIAPLIDVVFLLLIFFMLTSTMIQPEGIELNLPQSDSATRLAPNTITVSANAERDIAINSIPVELGELSQVLKAELGEDRSKSIVFRADSSLEVQFFVAVMDAIRAAGIRDFSIATVDRVAEGKGAL